MVIVHMNFEFQLLVIQTLDIIYESPYMFYQFKIPKKDE